MKSKSFWNKVISLITIFFFAWESAVAYSLPVLTVVPTAIASVDSDTTSAVRKSAILLLNAHASSEAQRNISELLKLFQSQGVHLVGVEGADGAIDGAPFRKFPLKESLDQAAWKMVEEGIFTGAEYFYITSRNVPSFYGLEDRDLYLQNRDAFVKTIEASESAQDALTRIQDAMSALKQKIYSKDLYDLDRARGLYKEGDLSFINYLSEMVRSAKRARLSLAEFENFYRLSRAIEKEKKISRNRLGRELERLERSLLKKDPLLVSADTFELIRGTSTSNVSSDELFETYQEIHDYLSGLAAEGHLQLAKYRHLKKYLEWLDAFIGFQSKAFFSELQEVEVRTLKKLARSKKEQKLVGLSNQFETYLNLISIQLTQKEWATIDASRASSKLNELLTFISSELKERAPEISTAHLDLMKQAQQSAIKFYGHAENRNEVFSANIVNAMEQAREDVSLVVVGGFHEKGLVEALEKRGVTTAVISPRINDSGSDIPYHERMLGRSTKLQAIIDQAVSGLERALVTAGIVSKDVKTKVRLQLETRAAIHALFTANPNDRESIARQINRAARKIKVKPLVRGDDSDNGFLIELSINGKRVVASVKHPAGSDAVEITELKFQTSDAVQHDRLEMVRAELRMPALKTMSLDDFGDYVEALPGTSEFKTAQDRKIRVKKTEIYFGYGKGESYGGGQIVVSVQSPSDPRFYYSFIQESATGGEPHATIFKRDNTSIGYDGAPFVSFGYRPAPTGFWSFITKHFIKPLIVLVVRDTHHAHLTAQGFDNFTGETADGVQHKVLSQSQAEASHQSLKDILQWQGPEAQRELRTELRTRKEIDQEDVVVREGQTLVFSEAGQVVFRVEVARVINEAGDLQFVDLRPTPVGEFKQLFSSPVGGVSMDLTEETVQIGTFPPVSVSVGDYHHEGTSSSTTLRHTHTKRTAQLVYDGRDRESAKLTVFKDDVLSLEVVDDNEATRHELRSADDAEVFDLLLKRDELEGAEGVLYSWTGAPIDLSDDAKRSVFQRILEATPDDESNRIKLWPDHIQRLLENPDLNPRFLVAMPLETDVLLPVGIAFREGSAMHGVDHVVDLSPDLDIMYQDYFISYNELHAWQLESMVVNQEVKAVPLPARVELDTGDDTHPAKVTITLRDQRSELRSTDTDADAFSANGFRLLTEETTEDRVRIADTLHRHDRYFDLPATVATMSPARSHFGAHVDYPTFPTDGSAKNYSLVVGLSLNTIVTGRKRADDLVRLYSVSYDDYFEFHLSELQELARDKQFIEKLREEHGFAAYALGIFYQAQIRGFPLSGGEFTITGNVPLAKGLSSSASYIASLGRAAVDLYDWPLDPDNEKWNFAKFIRESEHADYSPFVGALPGHLDHIAVIAAEKDSAVLLNYGSQTDDAIEIIPIDLGEFQFVTVDTTIPHTEAVQAEAIFNTRVEELKEVITLMNQLLGYTEGKRKTHISSFTDKEFERVDEFLLDADPTLYKRARHVIRERDRTLKAAEALRRGDVMKAGELLNASGDSLSMKGDYQLTGSVKGLGNVLDILMSAAREDGVAYGRMVGRGGAGAPIFLVKKSEIESWKGRVQRRLDQWYKMSGGKGFAPKFHLNQPSQGTHVVWRENGNGRTELRIDAGQKLAIGGILVLALAAAIVVGSVWIKSFISDDAPTDATKERAPPVKQPSESAPEQQTNLPLDSFLTSLSRTELRNKLNDQENIYRSAATVLAQQDARAELRISDLEGVRPVDLDKYINPPDTSIFRLTRVERDDFDVPIVWNAFFHDGLWTSDDAMYESFEEWGAAQVTTNQSIVQKKSSTWKPVVRAHWQQGLTPEESFVRAYHLEARRPFQALAPVREHFDPLGNVSQEASALITDRDTLVRAMQEIDDFFGGNLEQTFVKLPNIQGGVVGLPNVDEDGPNAAHQRILAGRSGNITLGFSFDHYLAFAEKHVLGLQALIGKMVAEEKSEWEIYQVVSRMNWVFSLFMSRIDRKVEPWFNDAIKEAKAAGDGARVAELKLLRGKTSVALGRFVSQMMQTIYFDKPLQDAANFLTDDQKQSIIGLRNIFSGLHQKYAVRPLYVLIASSGRYPDQTYATDLQYVLPFLGLGIWNTLPGPKTIKALSEFVANPVRNGRTFNVDDLKARNLLQEELPWILQGSVKDSKVRRQKMGERWDEAILLTSEERRSRGIDTKSASWILKRTEDLLLAPRASDQENSFRALGDERRDNGAASFAKAEEQMLDLIRGWYQEFETERTELRVIDWIRGGSHSRGLLILSTLSGGVIGFALGWIFNERDFATSVFGAQSQSAAAVPEREGNLKPRFRVDLASYFDPSDNESGKFPPLYLNHLSNRVTAQLAVDGFAPLRRQERSHVEAIAAFFKLMEGSEFSPAMTQGDIDYWADDLDIFLVHRNPRALIVHFFWRWQVRELADAYGVKIDNQGELSSLADLAQRHRSLSVLLHVESFKKKSTKTPRRPERLALDALRRRAELRMDDVAKAIAVQLKDNDPDRLIQVLATFSKMRQAVEEYTQATSVKLGVDEVDPIDHLTMVNGVGSFGQRVAELIFGAFPLLINDGVDARAREVASSQINQLATALMKMAEALEKASHYREDTGAHSAEQAVHHLSAIANVFEGWPLRVSGLTQSEKTIFETGDQLSDLLGSRVIEKLKSVQTTFRGAYERSQQDRQELRHSEVNDQLKAAARGEMTNKFSILGNDWKDPDLVDRLRDLLDQDDLDGALRLARENIEQGRPRLGWVDIVDRIIAEPELLKGVEEEIDEIIDDRDDFVFSGMGGSSLSVHLVNKVWPPLAGQPNIHVLDSTDPAYLSEFLKQLTGKKNPSRTLLAQKLRRMQFYDISKSGTTAETKSHLVWIESLYERAGVDPKDHIVLVSDPGSKFDAEASEKGYRFDPIQLDERNDVGGRYTSPGTRVFLLAAAIRLGILNLMPLLKDVEEYDWATAEDYINLGGFLYEQAVDHGATKVTFLAPKEIAYLGAWAEQLFEESLGKDEKGFTVYPERTVNIKDLEASGRRDSVFLHFKIAGAKDPHERFVSGLKKRNYPVWTVELESVNELPGVLLGLQKAVAAAAYYWNINFVNQPEIDGLKAATRAVKDAVGDQDAVKKRIEESEQFDKIRHDLSRVSLLFDGVPHTDFDLPINAAEAYAEILSDLAEDNAVTRFQLTHVGKMSKQVARTLARARNTITRQTTWTGKVQEAPQMLHSIEQQNEGGPNNGFFTVIIAADHDEPKTYQYAESNRLLKIQAVGNYNRLIDRYRKSVMLVVPKEDAAGAKALDDFFTSVAAALERRELRSAEADGKRVAQIKDQLAALINDVDRTSPRTYLVANLVEMLAFLENAELDNAAKKEVVEAIRASVSENTRRNKTLRRGDYTTETAPTPLTNSLEQKLRSAERAHGIRDAATVVRPEASAPQASATIDSAYGPTVVAASYLGIQRPGMASSYDDQILLWLPFGFDGQEAHKGDLTDTQGVEVPEGFEALNAMSEAAGKAGNKAVRDKLVAKARASFDLASQEDHTDVTLPKVTPAKQSAVQRSNSIATNIDHVRELLDPDSTEWPYDIEIISNTSEDERALREDEMKAITRGKKGPSGNPVVIVSMIEEWNKADEPGKGGAGNLLGSVNAYLDAVKSQYDVSIDVDGYFRSPQFRQDGEPDGELAPLRIRHILNGGRAKRCNGLNQCENSSRGSLRMFGSIRTKDENGGYERRALTLFALVAGAHLPLGASNDGRYIDDIYAGQVAIPSRDVLNEPTPEAMVTKFAQELAGDSAVTPRNLRDLGVYEADADARIIESRPKGSFEGVDAAKEWLADHDGYYSYGSHRIHGKFVKAYARFYLEVLKGKRNINREPPEFIKPMSVLLSGIKRLGSSAGLVVDVNTAFEYVPELAEMLQQANAAADEKFPGLENRLERQLKKEAELAKIVEVIEFYLLNNHSLGPNWLAVYDMGADLYWDRFRRPLEYTNANLSLLGVYGIHVELDDQGQLVDESGAQASTEYFGHPPASARNIQKARDYLALRGITHPIVSTTLGGVHVDEQGRLPDGTEVTFKHVVTGIEVGGVRVQNSIIRNSVLLAGSKVTASLVEDTTTLLIAENSFIERSIAPRFLVQNGLVYNAIHARSELRTEDEKFEQETDVVAESPGWILHREQVKAAKREQLLAAISETTNFIEWFVTLKKLRELSPGHTNYVRIQVARGITVNVPIDLDVIFLESSYRYLATWVYYLGAEYGTDFVAIGVPGQPELINVARIQELLEGELGDVRETLGEISHEPLGIRNYGNAGREVKFIKLTDLTDEQKQKVDLRSKTQLDTAYPGRYLGIDVGGTSAKFGIIEDGVFVPVEGPWGKLPTDVGVDGFKESGTSYISRIAARANMIQGIHGSFDGVGIVMPGAEDIPNNRLVTFGQITSKKEWTEDDIEQAGALATTVAEVLGLVPERVIVRNDMQGILTGVASVLEKAKPDFVKKTGGDYRFDWMGTGHGHQLAVNGKPIAGPTEAGHLFVDFGRPGEVIIDTEAHTSIPSLIAVAEGAGFPDTKGEFKPIGDAAADETHEYHEAAIAALKQFAKYYAQNLIVGYLITEHAGIGNGAQVLLGGGITLGQTGAILRELTIQELDRLGFKGDITQDGISIDVFTEDEIEAVVTDPSDLGAIGAATLIQNVVAEQARVELRTTESNDTAVRAAKESAHKIIKGSTPFRTLDEALEALERDDVSEAADIVVSNIQLAIDKHDINESSAFVSNLWKAYLDLASVERLRSPSTVEPLQATTETSRRLEQQGNTGQHPRERAEIAFAIAAAGLTVSDDQLFLETLAYLSIGEYNDARQTLKQLSEPARTFIEAEIIGGIRSELRTTLHLNEDALSQIAKTLSVTDDSFTSLGIRDRVIKLARSEIIFGQNRKYFFPFRAVLETIRSELSYVLQAQSLATQSIAAISSHRAYLNEFELEFLFANVLGLEKKPELKTFTSKAQRGVEDVHGIHVDTYDYAGLNTAEIRVSYDLTDEEGVSGSGEFSVVIKKLDESADLPVSAIHSADTFVSNLKQFVTQRSSNFIERVHELVEQQNRADDREVIFSQLAVSTTRRELRSELRPELHSSGTPPRTGRSELRPELHSSGTPPRTGRSELRDLTVSFGKEGADLASALDRLVGRLAQQDAETDPRYRHVVFADSVISSALTEGGKVKQEGSRTFGEVAAGYIRRNLEGMNTHRQFTIRNEPNRILLTLSEEVSDLERRHLITALGEVITLTSSEGRAPDAEVFKAALEIHTKLGQRLEDKSDIETARTLVYNFEANERAELRTAKPVILSPQSKRWAKDLRSEILRRPSGAPQDDKYLNRPELRVEVDVLVELLRAAVVGKDNGGELVRWTRENGAYIDRAFVEAHRADFIAAVTRLEAALLAFNGTRLEQGPSYAHLSGVPEFDLEQNYTQALMAVGQVLGFWQVYPDFDKDESESQIAWQTGLFPMIRQVNRDALPEPRVELRADDEVKEPIKPRETSVSSSSPIPEPHEPEFALERLRQELPPATQDEKGSRAELRMLVLSRRVDQEIVINNDISVTVTQIRGDRAWLSIEGTGDLPVHKGEVLERILAGELEEERKSLSAGNMIVVSRAIDETVAIGRDITITIVAIRGDKVRLGIDAPPEIPVHRREVQDAIQRELGLKPESDEAPEEGDRTELRIAAIESAPFSAAKVAAPSISLSIDQLTEIVLEALKDSKTILIELSEAEVDTLVPFQASGDLSTVGTAQGRQFLEMVSVLATLGIRVQFVVRSPEAESTLRKVLQSFLVSQQLRLPAAAQPQAKDIGDNGARVTRTMQNELLIGYQVSFIIVEQAEAVALAPRISDATFITHRFSKKPLDSLLEKIRIAIEAVLLREGIFRALEKYENIVRPDLSIFENLEQALAVFKKVADRIASAA